MYFQVFRESNNLPRKIIERLFALYLSQGEQPKVFDCATLVLNELHNKITSVLVAD